MRRCGGLLHTMTQFQNLGASPNSLHLLINLANEDPVLAQMWEKGLFLSYGHCILITGDPSMLFTEESILHLLPITFAVLY